jgi:hypothetical protein
VRISPLCGAKHHQTERRKEKDWPKTFQAISHMSLISLPWVGWWLQIGSHFFLFFRIHNASNAMVTIPAWVNHRDGDWSGTPIESLLKAIGLENILRCSDGYYIDV